LGYGTIGVDPGAPNGAVKGRWRFRPPCQAFGTVAAKADKACIMNASGTFLPPPREVRAVIEGAWLPNAPAGTVPLIAANGITAGQYRNPAIEYIFPENVPGKPIVPNNFDTIPFLAQGGYPSGFAAVGATPYIPGQLNPWPGNTIPALACNPATASVGGPFTVAAGGSVALSGTAGGTGPFTFAWTVSSGTVAPANTAATTFSAVGATSPVTATLTVTGACGTASASTTITVNTAQAPTVGTVAPITLFAGAAGSFNLTATDPNVPAQAVTFAVTQTGAPALVNLKVTSTGPASATVTFTAPTLPVGAPADVISLTITATNSGGVTSAAAGTTVTVNALPDVVTIASVEMRVTKQRLIVTASSSDPNALLFLNPYLTTTGVIFDPNPLGAGPFTDVAGVLTLTLVGAPEPALPPATPVTVRSSSGGVSAPSGITKVR